MKQKYYYYVVVCNDNKAKFITSLDNKTKYAHWNTKEPPMAFSRGFAEDIAYCLNLNMYPAFVLKSYYEIEEQIFIKLEDR